MTVVLSAPIPMAGHCQPMPLAEMPGHSQAILAQSLVGPDEHKILFVPSIRLFLQSCGIGEDSLECLGLQGDQTSQS